MARELAKRVYEVTKTEPWKFDTRFVQQIHASDVGFIEKDTAKQLYEDCLALNKAIANFIKSLKTSGLKGSTFQDPGSKFQDLKLGT